MTERGDLMKVTGILFDKDGTLMNFDSFWVSVSVVAVKEVLKQFRQEESLADEILEAFGVHNGVTDPDGVLCKGTYGEMAEIFCGILEEKGSLVSLTEAEEKLEEVYLTIVNRKYNVSKTEEYIKELTEAHKRKGVSNNLRIGVNTIREAYELCKRSGIDSDMQVTEYEDNVKIVIRMKK